MKVLSIISRIVFFVALILAILVFALIILLDSKISEQYKINSIKELNLNTKIPVTAIYNGYDENDVFSDNDTYRVDLKMFGVIPFSSTTVQVVDKNRVAVLGSPFGIKIYTDGVLVVDIKDVNTESGAKDLAKSAGLKIGDYIRSVDGQRILSNEDLSEIVENSGGNTLTLTVYRAKKKKSVKIKPEIEADSGKYRVGIWVRDSSAGIGTLTFYSPYSNVICGLGHEISDVDTGEKLDVNTGEMVSAEIISVNKGKNGAPGELVGKFGYSTFSDSISNEENGVYGTLVGTLQMSALTEVALKQDVKNGQAQILTTVNGDTPKLYDCEITLSFNPYKSKSQNFIVTVTDKGLMNATGGIVQGMSGSPILQDGKLIGAVTHVFLDDPAKGYGVFAENMLDTANELAANTAMKKAS